jgi:hypoxanthine phosphoribosyltransferase
MSDPLSEASPGEVALLFTAEEIARRVDGLAGEIASAISEPFTVVVVLKGAFVFAADLLRALSRRGCHPRIEFVRLASYGNALQSSGTVRLQGAPLSGIEGCRVLIVDDVLDTGLTLMEAQRLLRACGAAAIRTCVLVRKEGKQTAVTPVDFVGFSIGDHFVVGYGIDCAERYRDLPYLGAVEAAS